MLDNRETFLTKTTKNELCTTYILLSCMNDTDFLLAQLDDCGLYENKEKSYVNSNQSLSIHPRIQK